MLATEGHPAEAKCQPFRALTEQAYHDGWYKQPGTTAGGVYASIWNYDPWVQPGSNADGQPRFSAAYVLLTKISPLGYWAQVGWIEFASDVRHSFLQVRNGPGTLPFTKFIDPPQPEATFTYYTVLYNNTPGKFTFFVGGAQVWQPETAYWAPDKGEISGEINVLASQMPGGYSNFNYDWLSDSHIWYNAVWQSFNGSVYNPYSQYFGVYVLNPHINLGIYDLKCPD